MRRIIFFILLSLVLLGCSARKYSYSLYNTKEEYNKYTTKGFSFNIDSNFRLYARDTYSYEKNGAVLIARNSANDTVGKRLIDRSFLLVSDKIVIYLTYRPDKYLNGFPGLEMNAFNFYYLRSMQFGQITDEGSTFRFASAKDSSDLDEWKIIHHDSIIKLYDIDEIRKGIYHNTLNMDRAFGNRVEFKEVSNYKLIYQEPKDDEETPEWKKWQDLHFLEHNTLSLSDDSENLMMNFKEPSSRHQIYLSYRKSRLLYNFQHFFAHKISKNSK